MTATLQDRPVLAPSTPTLAPQSPTPLRQSRGPGVARSLVRAARPHQWAKNALVGAGPALAGALGDGPTVLRAGVATVAWCLVASAAYLVNDLRDAAADRAHPTKCRRPIASGALPRRTATAAAGVGGAAGMVLAAGLGLVPFLLLAGYVLLTVAYSLRLKRVPYVEMGIVAAGFVLRAATGASATAIAISPALLVAFAAVAVLATAGKRLGELHELGIAAAGHRAVLGRYRTTTLTRLTAVAATVAATSYTWWAFTTAAGAPSFGWLASSAAFVLLVDRYAAGAVAGDAGDPFDAVRTDRRLRLLAGAWLLATVLAVTVG